MKIKHILLFLMAWVSSMNLAYAQQTVVASGSVMDEKGELLIGVSISVKEKPARSPNSLRVYLVNSPGTRRYNHGSCIRRRNSFFSRHALFST